MLKTIRATVILGLALGFTSVALAAGAEPTMDEVYQSVRAGHVAQAEEMMTQVLRAHPQSAKAHYVAAEVYARAGDAPLARQELATAQRLEPGLPFARAESVEALRTQLAQTQGGVRARQAFATPRGGFPLTSVLLLLAGVFVLWRIFRRRPAPVGAYPQYSGAVPAGGGAGAGPYYGGPGMGQGMGSGIAGGLASGLAVGAGVVAGEELAHHFLDRPGEALPHNAEPASPVNDDVGGNDFGVSDANSWDDGGGSAGGDFGGDGGGGGDWT